MILVASRNLPKLLRLLATRLPPTKAGFESYCPALAQHGLASDYEGLLHLISTMGSVSSALTVSALGEGAVERISITQLGGDGQLVGMTGRLKNA